MKAVAAFVPIVVLLAGGGPHTFVCSLPRHAAAGMTGAVTVEP